MIETYHRLLSDLFSYREFQQAFHLFQALLWVLLAFIAICVVLHVIYLLGYQSLLYRKRSPRKRWNRSFFGMSGLTALMIIAVIKASEWLAQKVIID